MLLHFTFVSCLYAGVSVQNANIFYEEPPRPEYETNPRSADTFMGLLFMNHLKSLTSNGWHYKRDVLYLWPHERLWTRIIATPVGNKGLYTIFMHVSG